MNRIKAWLWCYWHCELVKALPRPYHYSECPWVHPELWRKATDQHLAKHDE